MILAWSRLTSIAPSPGHENAEAAAGDRRRARHERRHLGLALLLTTVATRLGPELQPSSTGRLNSHSQ